MTFTGTSLDVARLQGCPFAVTAPGPFLPIAQALVVELGGEPFIVPPADRAAYHAALTHGANHLVTLVAQARRILTAAGIGEPGSVLGPLLTAALDGALRDGEAHLTGPVVRGDLGTVRTHLAALDELGEDDIAATYRHLAATTARRAAANGRIPDAVAGEIVELTSASGSGNLSDDNAAESAGRSGVVGDETTERSGVVGDEGPSTRAIEEPE